MNESDDFLNNPNIDEEIDLDEVFSKEEIDNNKMSFQKIKDICLMHPFYKRRDFDTENYNFLNICYDCSDCQTINAMLNRHSARKKYQFSYTLLMAIICNPHISEKQKCYMIKKLVNLGTEINHSNIKYPQNWLNSTLKPILKNTALFKTGFIIAILTTF